MSELRPSQRILFLDIETSPNEARVWGYYDQNVIEILKERELLSFAYKWQGEKTIHVHSKEELKTKDLLRKLHDILDEADVIIGHNSKKFDIRMVNTFFVRNDFSPPSPYQQIDTLQIARAKFRFNSNHLNDLGEFLGLGKKVETGGYKLWKNCLAGNKKSWKLMRKYNKVDVALLEKVYDKLSPWADRTPINSYGMFCPNCGSHHIIKRGFKNTATFKAQRYKCLDCGKWSQSNYRDKLNIGEYLK